MEGRGRGSRTAAHAFLVQGKSALASVACASLRSRSGKGMGRRLAPARRDPLPRPSTQAGRRCRLSQRQVSTGIQWANGLPTRSQTTPEQGNGNRRPRMTEDGGKQGRLGMSRPVSRCSKRLRRRGTPRSAAGRPACERRRNDRQSPQQREPSSQGTTDLAPKLGWTVAVSRNTGRRSPIPTRVQPEPAQALEAPAQGDVGGSRRLHGATDSSGVLHHAGAISAPLLWRLDPETEPRRDPLPDLSHRRHQARACCIQR